MARAAGKVREATSERIVVVSPRSGEAVYSLQARTKELVSDAERASGLLILPRATSWQEPVVEAGREVRKKELLAHLNHGLKRCAPLLRKYLQELDDQIDMVYTVQEVCEEDALIAKVFAGVLHTLYDADVVGEDAVLAWSKECKDQDFLKRAAPFLDWLAQADEEEDDEEDDE